MFLKPLAVNEGQILSGVLKFQANVKFSYDVEMYCKISCSGDEGGAGVETRCV